MFNGPFRTLLYYPQIFLPTVTWIAIGSYYIWHLLYNGR